MTESMRPEIKARWTTALRDPARRQGQGRLRDKDGRECCLGVLCDLAVRAGVGEWVPLGGGPYFQTPDGDQDGGVLPLAVAQWAGLRSVNPLVPVDAAAVFGSPVSLSELNDDDVPFAEIADIIDREL